MFPATSCVFLMVPWFFLTMMFYSIRRQEWEKEAGQIEELDLRKGNVIISWALEFYLCFGGLDC